MIKKLGALLFFLCALPMYASAMTIDVTYGLDDKVKMETPVRVDVVITNDEQPFDGSLLANFRESYQLQQAQVYPVSLAAGEQMTLSFFINNYQENMHNESEPAPLLLYDGDVATGRLVEATIKENMPTVHAYETVVVGTYKADAAYRSLQQLRAIINSDVVVEKLASAQQEWQDYALFDVIVLGEELATFTEQEQQALLSWVQDGGRLVMDTPLAKTVFAAYEPLNLTANTVTVPAATLQKLVNGGTFTSGVDVREATQQVNAWPNEDLTLAGKQAIVNGEVIQTAFALNDAQLTQADGYSYLFTKLIDFESLVWENYSELPHDQIVNTLTTDNELFEAFSFSVWKIIAVLSVYILLVTAILYVVLRKKDKREHAWWLIPVISVVFSVALFVVGAKDRLGKPQLQEMMLWTVTEDQSMQYFTQSVLANKAGDYQFMLQDGVAVATYERSGLATNAYPSYREGNELVMRDVPYWGVKSLVGSQSVATQDGYLEQQLTLANNQLTGEVTNHFPFALEQVQVWIGRDFYDIGPIAEGETIEVELALAQSYLVAASLSEELMYPQRDSELAVIRQSSLLRLVNNMSTFTGVPLIVAKGETSLPVQLKKEAVKQTDVLIATPLRAQLRHEGTLTLTEQDFERELIAQGNYSDWLSLDITEWYVERTPYTLKATLPQALQEASVTWQQLDLKNVDERLQVKVYNYKTGEYESAVATNAAAYVKDSSMQLQLQFVGSEMGDYVTLPTFKLKGEMKQ